MGLSVSWRVKGVPWFILVAIVVTELATSIYAPSLPKISEVFGINEALTELTISINIIAFALSGLLYGPLSDSYGRRPVLIVGIGVFFLGSLLCIFSDSYSSFLISRFIQGLGQGVALVVGLTSIKDLYKGEEAAKLFALLGMVISLSPGFAPMIGGYLAAHFSWSSPFVVMAILGAFLWGLFFFVFPETLVSENRSVFSFQQMKKSYLRLLRNKVFLRYAVIRVLTMGWFWGEVTNLPLVYIDGLKMASQKYGVLWGVGMFVYALSNITLQRVLSRWNLQQVLLAGLLFCVVSLLIQAVLYPLFWDIWPIEILHSIKFAGIFGIAYVMSTVTTLAFEASGKDAGAGSALLFAFQMGLGAVVIFMEGLFYNGTPYPIVAFGVALSGGALALYWYQRHKRFEN